MRQIFTVLVPAKKSEATDEWLRGQFDTWKAKLEEHGHEVMDMDGTFADTAEYVDEDGLTQPFLDDDLAIARIRAYCILNPDATWPETTARP